MILFHGSNALIEQVDLSHSRPNKDFGKAFYLSAEEQQASRFANVRVLIEEGSPIVSKFHFDQQLLTDSELKTLTFTSCTEEWTKFILANRSALPSDPPHGYDIVYGPMVDERMARHIAKYNEHYITFKMLVRNLRYMKGLTFQYALCTELAISKLRAS